MLSLFRDVGRDLFTRGLVSSHSGNMSIRLGDRLLITRRGCMLGCLTEHDLVETGVIKNDRSTPLASTELAIHRAIYRETAALAIIHAHPPHAIALSLTESEILPRDVEGSRLQTQVPVLGIKKGTRLRELTGEISQALNRYRVVAVQGHGNFAIGQVLDEAYHFTTALEESCRIICLLRALEPSSAQTLPATG